MASTPEFLEHLQDASDAAELGFFFEEGGCYGMAIALQEALSGDGLDARIVHVRELSHAYVEAGGRVHDYTGDCGAFDEAQHVVVESAEALMGLVLEAQANDEDSVLSDRDLAREIIENARELAVLAAAPQPRMATV